MSIIPRINMNVLKHSALIVQYVQYIFCQMCPHDSIIAESRSRVAGFQ
uniref:Uncharacterized protein n=1 Tax=Arundo donax TaxID=35708 RepID=A0A0A9DCV8_ARUDO